MANFKALFAVLFLSKLIVLTPQAVDLGPEWVEVNLSAPLSAITPGAVLLVDVTNVPGVQRDFAALERMFPRGAVEAQLFPKTGSAINLNSSGGVALSKSSVELLVYSTDMPVNVDFTRLRIRSSLNLKHVSVRWQNYSK